MLKTAVSVCLSPGRRALPACLAQKSRYSHARAFMNSSRMSVLRPYLLADIGEGITECQIMSWAVKEGDSVQQFEPICEVQSDKASVEITSRFDGIVKKLHYQEGDVAKVGSALLDIDVSGDEEPHDSGSDPASVENEVEGETSSGPKAQHEAVSSSPRTQRTDSSSIQPEDVEFTSTRSSLLATPAVRRLLIEHDIRISDVQGTGQDGRVLKHDVLRYIELRSQQQMTGLSLSKNDAGNVFGDRRVALSPIQSQMFKSMTASLSVPHFLYTHTVDLTRLSDLMRQWKEDPSLATGLTDEMSAPIKLTFLPFVLKALSQAVSRFPAVNSLLDTSESADGQPSLLIKECHHFGLAVDTPKGLVVPVVRDVQKQSVLALAAETSRLAKLAKAGKLSPDEMKNATLVVSNIGSIGGNVVGPVIVSPMTAIMAIGQVEDVAAFETDKDGNERVMKKRKAVLSWSADHRVLDGATMARCAQEVAMWLERPELLGLGLK